MSRKRHHRPEPDAAKHKCLADYSHHFPALQTTCLPLVVAAASKEQRGRSYRDASAALWIFSRETYILRLPSERIYCSLLQPPAAAASSAAFSSQLSTETGLAP
jgi:hypothetical protein